MKKQLLSLLMVTGLVLSACTPVGTKTTAGNATENSTTTTASEGATSESQANGNTSNAGPVSEAKKDAKQVFNSYLQAEPSTLDAAKAADSYSIGIIQNVFEPLLFIEDGGDGKIKYTPAGAESWEISEDGKTYTFKLRDNKWSDGKPVKAQDYVDGILRVLTPDTASPNSYMLEPIAGAVDVLAGKAKPDTAGVKAIDEKTLEIKLTAPTPHFIGVCANPAITAIRKDVLDKNKTKYGSEANMAVYNGAFVVSEWVHNSKVTLKKNPNYWNAAKVNFETVNLPVMTDANTAMNSMETGAIDSVGTNIAEWYEKFKANPNIVHKAVETQSTFFMIANTKDKVMKNVKIRKAIAAALDREDLNQVIFGGFNKAARGWIPGSIYVGEKGFIENTPNLIEKLQSEVPDAKALLVEGLTELGLDPDPAKLTISLKLGSTDQWFKNYGEYLQQVLNEKLGINLEIQQMEWTVFEKDITKANYQLGYMAWGSNTVEPFDMLSLHTTKINALGTNWSNPEYDKLVAAATIELDEAKRLQLYQQAEEILMNESPVIPVVHAVNNSFVQKYVQGLDYNPFSNTGYRVGFTSGR